ncbi:MAG: hypothetical protein ACTJGG_01840 [Marinomonas foliarum]|jgi:DNA-binding transcriptional MerR regulator
MSPEILDILKAVLSALVGASLTFGVIAKFGESWFFKKLDAKYAIDLAKKNSQLKGDLEEKKNELNKELQIEVTHFKAQLDVIGGQKSKFLERQIDNILLVSQQHYLAVKNIKEYIDDSSIRTEQARSYFFYQIGDGEREELSDYDVYRRIGTERNKPLKEKANRAYEKYAECLAINMPILPSDLVKKEMKILDDLKYVLDKTNTAFSRSMAFSEYILNPEECETTVDECMKDLICENEVVLSQKEIIDQYSDALFAKSLESGQLIESLLIHEKANG